MQDGALDRIMQSDVILHLKRLRDSPRPIRALGVGNPEGTLVYIALPSESTLSVGYTRSREDNATSCVSMRAYSLMPEIRENGRERRAPASISMWIGDQENKEYLFREETGGRVEVENPVAQSGVSISWADEHGVAVVISNTPGQC